MHIHAETENDIWDLIIEEKRSRNEGTSTVCKFFPTRFVRSMYSLSFIACVYKVNIITVP